MVTKIKPRRVKTSTTWSLGDALWYQDESNFQWWWAGSWDMRYADFNFTTESWGSVVLGLRTEISPSENFTVAPPATVKDWQTYILRVTNWATAYTMALTWGITNPYSVPIALTANNTDQFEFLAVWNTLELQANNAEVTNVVRLTWDQTINWTKTFTISPVVPSKTTDATNTGIAIATEAQVYKKADATDVNTKTFYLSSTSDLTTAQAAIDWIIAWKTAFILFNGAVYKQRNRDIWIGSERFFFSTDDNSTVQNTNLWNTVIKHLELQINTNETTHIVTTVSSSEKYLWKYINIDWNYTDAFIPTQDYHPTTKKYVDDRDTYIWTSAPTANLVEGRLRYDTTNDVLKSYDGTNRNNVDTKVTVEDNLTSTSTTNALSANQWRILDWKIADLMALWKFLSLWDATTGQPISFPYTTPYAYSTWDFFLVETISSATPPVNYRPDWSSYTWTASSIVETDELEQGDVYIYDGSVWLLQSNHWKTVSFANIAGQPTDNTNLATALWNKQDTLSAWTWISISSNTVTNTWVTSFNWNTWAITYTAPVASVNTQTWAVVLDADDISDSTTTNKFVTATDKSTWNWKQNKHTATTATLSSASWTSHTQTVSVTWVTASNTVLVSPAPSSFAAYTNAVIYCSAQASWTLTFSCTTDPTSNITVNIIILN